VSNSPDKVSPVFSLYKNLIALERACGKDASSVRTCQRLLKASPKKIELWLCMSALQQVSGQEDGAVNVYKKALETCNGHAQIAYCAAKYFIQTVFPTFSFPVHVKKRVFCMLRNTRSKLMNILFHLVRTIFNFLIKFSIRFSSGKQT
jgi:hypothetical protein